ncbi:MAG: HNH endonuclease [Myxococcus sp.]|nr:HNH endonuclease [Myxococcus sp.]
MAAQRRWTRAEQLLALELYLSLPFGRLHRTAPEVVAVAKEIDRTPSSVAMKACNFASLDESFTSSGRAGLEGASAADRALWQEFLHDRDRLVEEMETRVLAAPPVEVTLQRPEGPTEVTRSVRQRRRQAFFARVVRAAYAESCAVTGLAVASLNVASHIIPWAENEARRTDPCNGLLLSALVDRAFDRGLVAFDERSRLVCAKRLKEPTAAASALVSLEGTTLRAPEKFHPDPSALAWHRERWAENF